MRGRCPCGRQLIALLGSGDGHDGAGKLVVETRNGLVGELQSPEELGRHLDVDAVCDERLGDTRDGDGN
jgi:hypothetical protein